MHVCNLQSQDEGTSICNTKTLTKGNGWMLNQWESGIEQIHKGSPLHGATKKNTITQLIIFYVHVLNIISK